MAVRFIDSFNHYPSGDILKKWTGVAGSVSIVTGGRTGTYCMGITPFFLGSSRVYKVLDNQQHWTCGFAFKTSASNSFGPSLCGLFDGSDLQIGAKLNPDGTLQFHKGSTIGSTSSAITFNVWHYLEVKFEVSNSCASSSCVIRLDGTDVVTLSSGTSTRGTGNNYANTFYIGDLYGPNSVPTNYYGDLYLSDDATFLGDCSAEVKTVTGAATYTDFTLPGSSTAQGAVSFIDGTYLSSNTLHARESFNFSDLVGGIADIKAIQLVAAASKNGSGSRSLKHFVRSGSTNYDQTAIPQGTGFAYSMSVLETNPATGVAWTESDVASLEAGIEVA